MTFTCTDVARAANLGSAQRAGQELAFTCPRHDDQHPSLKVNPTKDAWICGPCGESGNAWQLAAFINKLDPNDKDSVMGWLRKRGLLNGAGNGNTHGYQHSSQSKLPETSKGRPIKCWYHYEDEDGATAFSVARIEYQRDGQRKKDFPVWCQGSWGTKDKKFKKVIYRLRKVLEAKEVWLCEGEEDVHTLEGFGFAATTAPGCAHSPSDWNEYCRYFNSSQTVFALRDNDEAGLRRRDEACQALRPIVAAIRAIEFCGLEPGGDVSNWARPKDPTGAGEELAILAEQAQEWIPSGPSSKQQFEAIGEGRYRLTLPTVGVVFEIDRLRRDRHELIGELSVRCDLPGSRTFDGVLSSANFNVSSARARTERAKLLAARSVADELDWPALVEEFCQRVLVADRTGQPAIDLRALARPTPDDAIRLEGLVLPRRHPAILFGDGGSAKSYTGLYLAGRLVQQGFTVALFDWELAGEDHRDRLERLFGPSMPRIFYARCDRALVHEVDRLTRIVQEHHIDYALYDSVAFACDGPPESAEVASSYFRAVRQVGVGSLHIAHISRGEGNDQKPFGSAFWHNGARSTWYVKLADASPDGHILNLGFFNRKANLGRLCFPTGFKITFMEDSTLFSRSNPADNPDLATSMSVRQRMAHLLRNGAMDPANVASEIEADVETVRRTARRHKDTFTILDGGKLALLARSS
jgi:CHC2-type zinc finger protein